MTQTRSEKAAYLRRWLAENPDRKATYRERALATKYGLTVDQYQALPRECEACGSATRLVVHHDHACCPVPPACGACVLGRLCAACNCAAGYLREDPARVQALADYLVRLRELLERGSIQEIDDAPDEGKGEA